MTPLSKLAEILSTLPGIGPRHAERLAYFISEKNENFINELKNVLKEISLQRKRCVSCRAVFYIKDKDIKECPICTDKSKNDKILVVTDTEINRNSIEKSGVNDGRYFILGKTLPVTDRTTSKLPIPDLINRIEKMAKNGLKEVILIFSYTPEGEHTTDMIKKKIESSCKKNKVIISSPGRGFSTGTEVEYSDDDTLKHAFKNRTSK